MKICHISDTHGSRGHTPLIIPEVDVLIHSGDIGGVTTLRDLTEFLIWMEKQPAKKKIFCAGNHDWILSKEPGVRYKRQGSVYQWLTFNERYNSARELLNNYDVEYLENSEYVYEGIKFYGSPYSPSFHRESWVFNSDRGPEIRKHWNKIPPDVNVLITHSPPYGVLDVIPESYKLTPTEDVHRGCFDLMDIIERKLLDLKLHTFGHIHSQTDWISKNISDTRNIIFSNGAVLDNDYKQVVANPLIINI